MKNRATGEYSGLQSAVFGGGCFWCVESAFSQLKGVQSAVSGYSGGPYSDAENPSYESVCSGKTGHAEVVRIEYDPKIVSYWDLLKVFFAVHDPTSLNRQGADAGTQYRSIILYSNLEQKAEAEKYISELETEKVFESPVVTEVKPLERFFPAEEYHQKYFEKNPRAAYCRINIPSKIEKIRKKFGDLMK
jgi:peptide-methionine (S)-S-oxide reductase